MKIIMDLLFYHEILFKYLELHILIMEQEKFQQFVDMINYNMTEGCIIGEEAGYLMNVLMAHLHLTNILEIGFNGGISAAAILSTNPDITLTSIDLGEHDYIHQAKANIDAIFPGRHTLLVGSSLDVVPQLVKDGAEFDFIFIDGGHLDPIPRMDIENCRGFVKDAMLVMIDDWCDSHGCHGVNQAIEDNLTSGVLVLKDRQVVADRGWGLFKLMA